jgi:hypothetical protein
MAYPESLCLQGTRPPTYPWESLDHGLFNHYFWRNNPTIRPNTEEGEEGDRLILCAGIAERGLQEGSPVLFGGSITYFFPRGVCVTTFC